MIKASIKEEQLNDFNRDGFLSIDKFLNLQYIDDLKNRVALLFDGVFETGIEPDEWNWRSDRGPHDVTRQICNAWKSDKLIKQLVCNPVIGECISKLMGWNGARLIQDNVLWKPPQGKPLNYHQDAAYDDWIIPQTMATCWITLDDAYIDNGGLEFATGSHKWGLSQPSANFHAPKNYKKELNDFVKHNEKTLHIAGVDIPAGGASFHHGMTWHGSGVNNSSTHRRAIVAHCVPSDATFHPTNCGGTGKIYRKYKLIESDELNDSFFPLLWENSH
jgi:ectoine hydroxylase-related dioxygenase (phytanoyl-CoA dioxygenase family)